MTLVGDSLATAGSAERPAPLQATLSIFLFVILQLNIFSRLLHLIWPSRGSNSIQAGERSRL